MKYLNLEKLTIRIHLFLVILLYSACLTEYGDRHMSEGINHYLAEEYEKSEVSLRKALDLPLVDYPKKELFTTLGNTYNELEKYDSAIVYHEKAIALDSNYINAWVNLGIVYRLTAQYDLAEKCYLKASEINPEDPELQTSLGVLYIYKDDVERAIQHLEKAIELDGQLAISHSNYAVALAMVGRFERAEAELKRAVLLGYKNGEAVKERIKELRMLEE